MLLQVFQSGVVNKQDEQDGSIAQGTIFKSVTSNNCLREVKHRTGVRSAGHLILILMEA
jgi:uncharacterized protein YwbE